MWVMLLVVSLFLGTLGGFPSKAAWMLLLFRLLLGGRDPEEIV